LKKCLKGFLIICSAVLIAVATKNKDYPFFDLLWPVDY
jgi:hypothetical protein